MFGAASGSLEGAQPWMLPSQGQIHACMHDDSDTSRKWTSKRGRIEHVVVMTYDTNGT